jgi:hypothetical protein
VACAHQPSSFNACFNPKLQAQPSPHLCEVQRPNCLITGHLIARCLCQAQWQGVAALCWWHQLKAIRVELQGKFVRAAGGGRHAWGVVGWDMHYEPVHTWLVQGRSVLAVCLTSSHIHMELTANRIFKPEATQFLQFLQRQSLL